MGNIIERVNVNGTTYDIASTAYAVCSNGATENKTINIDGFSLVTGVTIHVKFANANTDPTKAKLTISGGDSNANNPIPIIGHTTWTEGAVFTLTYDGTNWVQDYDKIIENTITGSGTSGYLAKFNGTNSITNGPQLGNTVTNQTQDTLFLRSDGIWAKPSYTTNSDEKVKQSPITATTSAEYNILLKNSTGNSEETDIVKFANNSSKQVTINPSTGKITAPGGLAGNASSATGFSSAKTIALTGNVTGSATGGNSTNGWSIATTIEEGVVTNAMLAGSITNAKLSNSSITIAGQPVSLGSSLAASTLRSALGLTQALRFVGTTTTTMSDGYTGTPAGISIYTGDNAVAPAVGDVVLDSSNNAEYACTSVSGTTYTWELLGRDSSWALDSDVLKKTGSKGDIIYWSDTNNPVHLTAGSNGQVLKMSNTGVPVWGTDNNDNTKVTQNILATSVTDTYPLLVSYYKTGATQTTTQTANRIQAIYVQPSTGTLTATEFVGGGSGLTGVSVDWANVDNKVLANLYVNATSGGSTSNAAVSSGSTYIHLYDNNTKQATISLTGAGGTTITTTNSKAITITSKTYTEKTAVSVLNSLKLKYTDTTTTPNATSHDDAVSNATATPTALGVVNNAVLFIKSLYYGTTSVSPGINEI